MDREKLLKDIDRTYTGLQHLDMQPTRNNTAIILDSLQVLEEIYSYLKNEEAAESEKKHSDDSSDGSSKENEVTEIVLN